MRIGYIITLAILLASCGKKAEIADKKEKTTPPAYQSNKGQGKTIQEARTYFSQFFVKEARVNEETKLSFLTTIPLPKTDRVLASNEGKTVGYEMALLLYANETFEFRYSETDGLKTTYTHPVVKGLWSIETQGRLVLPGVGFVTKWQVGTQQAVRVITETNFKSAGVKNKMSVLSFAQETK